MTKNELMDSYQRRDGVAFLIKHKNMKTVKFWVFDVKKGRKKGTLVSGFYVRGIWWVDQLKDIMSNTHETIFIQKENLKDWERYMVQFNL